MVRSAVTNRIYLSRTNLLVLLSKLDRKKNGEDSLCTIVKEDNLHPYYPQTMKSLQITALEDEEYYTDRKPGLIFYKDNPHGM